MSSEAKVGIFVFLGIVMLFFLSTQINKFSTGSKDGYKIDAILDNASGLEVYAKVKINGVEVGHVKSIYLKNNKPVATLVIYDDTEVPTDSIVLLASENMLGGKYVEIMPGEGTDFVASGGELNRQKDFKSFDETSTAINDAAVEFREFIKEAREVVNEESRERLKSSFENLQNITESIELIIAENRNSIREAVIELRDMSASLKDTGDKFGVSADTINAKLPNIMENADGILEENRKTLRDAIVNADSFFQEGEVLIKDNKAPLKSAISSVDGFFTKSSKVVDRIDQYLEDVAQSEIEVSLRSEALVDVDNQKSYFSVIYKPNPTRYYMLDITSTKDFSIYDEDGSFREPKKDDDLKTYISAQIGKRYNNTLLRAGLIENSGGLGVDYFAFNDDFKFTFEAFDFDARNDLRGDNPHLKAYIRYTMLKHVDTYLGYDNFLNSDASSVFAGVGVRFVDDDMKTLIGTVGGGASFLK